MQNFANWVVNHRKIIFILVLLTSLLSLYLLRDAKVNSDIISYLPQDNPTVLSFNEIGRKFGGNYIAMVALESDDIFSYESLRTIKALTDSIEKLDDVTSVTSLTNILDFKEIEGGLEVGKLISEEKIPRTQQSLNYLKKYTLSKSMYRGSLVSDDGKATVIIARLSDAADRIAVAKKIRACASAIVSNRFKVYYGGFPMQMRYLNRIIVSNMAFLTPIVALLIVLVLFFSFHSKRGILLPFTTVVLSTLWGFGAMVLLGYKITLITSIFPVLMLAIGSAYGIHMVNKYYEDIRPDSHPQTVSQKALAEVGIPIILAGLTTLFGFLSLLTSNLSLIQQFGIVSAIGILFALLASITFLPASLAQMPIDTRHLDRLNRQKKASFAVHLMDGFSAFIFKNEKLILLFALIVVVFGVLGFPRITRNVNMLEYFKPSSEIRQSESFMERKFGGSIPIQLHVKGDIKNPAVLREIRLIERKIATIPSVNKPQSIADLICEMNNIMNKRYVVPNTREGVGNLWFMLEGQDILSQMVTPDNQEAQIQANLGTMDTEKIIAIVDSVNHFLQTLPDTLVVLSRHSLPVIIRPLAKAYLFESIDRNLILELQKRDGDFQFSPGFRRELHSKFQENTLPDSVVEKIAKMGADYLASDESDIYITSPILRNRFRKRLVFLISTNAIQSNQIRTLLKRTIPSSYIEDSESLNSTGESISALVTDQMDRWKSHQIVEFLKAHLPAQISQSENFTRDIMATIWPLFDQMIFVDPETFYQWQKLAPLQAEEFVSLRVIQSGMAPIFKQLDSQLMRSQISSLGMALVLVLILLIIQFRSITGGLIGITPVLLTILINFGVMGFFHIPMDDATVMIASLAIGIGIDYSIHFAFRFKREHALQKDVYTALKITLDTTGVAILINASAVGLGFLVMLLSNIVPLQRFGWLTALAMFTSATGAIFVLPALIIVTQAGFVGNWESFKTTVDKNVLAKIQTMNKKRIKKGGK